MNALPLLAAAALMGAAGAPHCAAMCAAPCAAAVRACGRSRATPQAFQLGRVTGYATGGAIAASGVSLLRGGLGASAVLQPLWTLLHLAALALGLWMLLRGQVPALARAAPVAPALAGGGWQRLHGPARGALAGAAWIAWPCGLLQAALLLAALGDSAWQGAAAMGVFALASSPGLVAAPWLLARLGKRSGGRLQDARWPVRIAGLMLASGSLWALSHGLWRHVAGWCGG
jgi:hypothetical protein